MERDGDKLVIGAEMVVEAAATLTVEAGATITGLTGATTFASDAELITGTEDAKVVSPRNFCCSSSACS